VKKKRRNTARTRVAGALRMAALSLRNSTTTLGAYFRHAVFATARKLATLIYRLLRWRQAYVDEGTEAFEKRYEAIRISAFKAKAKDLGFELVPRT
jgi:transposase